MNTKNIKKKTKTKKKKAKNKLNIFNKEELQGYCVNKYQNGDIYLGYTINNIRNNNGLYYYNNNNSFIQGYYLGQWKNNLRQGLGIFIFGKFSKF